MTLKIVLVFYGHCTWEQIESLLFFLTNLLGFPWFRLKVLALSREYATNVLVEVSYGMFTRTETDHQFKHQSVVHCLD